MYRRLVVPLVALASLAALFMVVAPTGAVGDERGGLTVADDVYLFREDGVIETPVKGSLQVYGATATVRSVVAGDVLVVTGRVILEEGGRIDGNLIHAASIVEGAEGRVGGRIYPLATLEGAAASMTKSAVVASLLLAWLIVAVAVTLVSGREIRLSSAEIRVSPLHCFVVGLVAITSFVLTAIAFSYLVPYMVGIPLLAALGVFAILTKVYGMIAMFHAVGTLVAGARNRDQLGRRRWLRGDLAMVIIGILLLGAIRLVPVVGTIVWGLASVFGVGVALATRFGRRDPWFLEFRSVAA
jgi:hypothetical protein